MPDASGDHMPKRRAGKLGAKHGWVCMPGAAVQNSRRRKNAAHKNRDEMTDQGQARKAAAGEKVVIQKYANRRLYNKATSTYITLDDLAGMVREGVDFVVYDAKSGEDITRKVLTQIIFEEEGRGQNLLPIQFLRQLIGFYGDRMQAFLPSFLELSLDSFIRQQERVRDQITAVSPPSMGVFDEQIRQNMILFDRAMKMFTPFAFRADEAVPPAPVKTPAARDEDTLAALQKQVAAMQEQLAALTKSR
jgi:polyhydroxyalkanoate synthesis repressor PhaR